MSAEELLYPTTEDVHTMHEDIITNDPKADAGVKNPGGVESALLYVSVGYYNQVPETIHEKAAHLMRLLAAGHVFWDGNKRTALNATETFYDLNGYEFNHDDSGVRAILREFATDESSVDMDAVVSYCASHATKAEE